MKKIRFAEKISFIQGKTVQKGMFDQSNLIKKRFFEELNLSLIEILITSANITQKNPKPGY